MVQKNINQEFRLKVIDEIRNYFLKEKDKNELMSNMHKNLSMTPNSIEHFLILASAFTQSISIFAFGPLLGILTVITSCVIGLKICAIAVGTKRYKQIINKNREP